MIDKPHSRLASEAKTSKNLQKLIIRAQMVLSRNDQGSHTVPSAGLYPNQVLWDSCFVAIGRSHYGVERAKKEVTSLLGAQWSNGMIPHIIFDSEKKYWWDRLIWRSWVSKAAVKDLATSGISQPPMLAEAIVRVGQHLSAAKRLAWYKSVFPGLLAYHQWLYRERDPRHEGLVVQLHPWETGLDTSPPCMAELQAKSWPSWLKVFDNPLIDKVGEYLRFDNKFVNKGERASNAEALALYFLLRKIRQRKYDSETILENPSFAIQDITYNSILIRANALLSEIASTIRQDIPNDLQKHVAKTSRALDSLWDEADSAYYSRDFISNKLIKEPSIGTFMPLYAGTITKERATELVKLMENKASFGLANPLPSVPSDSSWFSADRYWQGPTWINTNWLIIDGLKRYGFQKQAMALTISSLRIVQESGFFEYFDPNTAIPHGADNFSWTAALTIDLAFDFDKSY
jgi:hypothetical protein